ncbi:MAG: site-2 protease family protein [Thermoanaerobaculia bacterium]
MENLPYIIVQVVILFFSLSVHESAHAWMADKLGDPTGRRLNRITLNPIRHIDLFGTLIIPAFLIIVRSPFVFGWAKPVPVNPFNFKDPYKGIALTSLSGPASNFLISIISFILFKIFLLFSSPGTYSEPIAIILISMIVINLLLGFFNLIPLPPLDGAGVLSGFFPDSAGKFMDKIQPFSLILLVLILSTGIFSKFFGILIGFVLKWLQ